MLYLSIDHPAISCHDVDRQVEWYCRNLGMKLIATNSQTPPSVMVGYDGEAAMIELMPVKDAGPNPAQTPRFQPGLRHLALRVGDREGEVLGGADEPPGGRAESVLGDREC